MFGGDAKAFELFDGIQKMENKAWMPLKAGIIFKRKFFKAVLDKVPLGCARKDRPLRVGQRSDKMGEGKDRFAQTDLFGRQCKLLPPPPLRRFFRWKNGP